MNTLPLVPKPWCCENCGKQLATIVHGEATLTALVILRPESVAVACPRCGHYNPWAIAGNNSRMLDTSKEVC